MSKEDQPCHVQHLRYETHFDNLSRKMTLAMWRVRRASSPSTEMAHGHHEYLTLGFSCRVQAIVQEKKFVPLLKTDAHEIANTFPPAYIIAIMPGIKRPHTEEDGVKLNGSTTKKVKSAAEIANKADKKFANKLAVRDKNKSKSDKTEGVKAPKKAKKAKKEKDVDVGGEGEDTEFGGFEDSADGVRLDVEGDDGEGKAAQEAKHEKTPKVLNGSADGENGTSIIRVLKIVPC